ncbi:TldD/PmbA family protein [Shumkonia mesophila]|uniref:TldD/PmbA family protein n=1 Tax=Shumkonia mesophila TaxID=2838854 RepID=UPI0029343D64|nr:metallopeptidase TldD-related protein [Shumkonia mesophila]
MTQPEQFLDRLQDLIGKARAAGADAADAVLISGTSLSVARRLGKPEHLERSEEADVGLRVFIGRRQAIVSSSDLSDAGLAELPARAVAMARSVPEDPYCGLAEPGLLAGDVPDLDMCDAAEPDAEALFALTAEAEEAAVAVPGVTNSEGAQAGWSLASVALAASNGMARAYKRSGFSLSAAVVAGEGTAMERDYDYSSAVHLSDLRAAADIGRSAGERTVRRLNPRRAASAEVSVVFDPRVSASLLGHLAGAINGATVARGTSFLKDRMDEKVFADGITIVDDPLRRRGLRSKPFDAEGVATIRRNVIEDGRLTTWILDLRSSRQLGTQTTGHATRGPSSPPSPSPTNFYLAPGRQSPAGLMADITSGLYVTELIGMGVNGVTGDYSRGAAGFWIENGELAYPVSEITIAGNLKDMFARMSAADDLEFRFGTDAPTVRIDAMALAGR